MTKKELRDLQISLAKLRVVSSHISEDMKHAVNFLISEIQDVLDGAPFDRFEVLQ